MNYIGNKLVNPFALNSRYRMFKANNRYSYPFLFFFMGALKNLCQFGALAVVGWTIYQVGSNKLQSDSIESRVSQESVVERVVIADAPIVTQPVEILALANDHSNKSLINTDSTFELIEMETAQQALALFDWEWVLKQDTDKFTIQFGSSPDKDLLYESARTFPTEEAVVVFPFKKTPSNRTVYGFSAGLYDSLEKAQQAIRDMPSATRAIGPWIRPIDELQKQIVVMLPR